MDVEQMRWHQHEGVTAGDGPRGNLLITDHRHAGGDGWHRHDLFEPVQLVVTDADGIRTVYGPDGQVRWSGSVDAPVHPQVLDDGPRSRLL